MSLIWALTTLVTLVTAQLTNPTQLPGFSTLRSCAQNALVCSTCILSGVEGDLGCSNWQCVCNDISVALSAVSLAASAECYNAQDAASATSVLSGFCEQLGPIPSETSSSPQTTLAPGQFTDPSQWPGFNILRSCAQDALVCSTCILSGVKGELGCSNWQCVCNDISAAMSVVSLVANAECYNTQDAASATSVLSGFCAQLPATGNSLNPGHTIHIPPATQSGILQSLLL